MKLVTTMAQRVGFEPTGDCSHDGFRGEKMRVKGSITSHKAMYRYA